MNERAINAMKRIQTLSIAMILVLLALACTGCGKSEFGATENEEHKMTITAENADKDAFFISGSLETEDGDEIVISASLTKGSIRVEILASPQQGMDEFPEPDETPIMTVNVSSSDKHSGTVPAGSYLVKATCLEKATGTVRIEVNP